MSSRREVSTTGWDRWSVLALAALAIAFAAVAGPIGLAAAVGVALVRYALETAGALAAGHLAMLGLFPGGIDPVSFVVVEAGLVLLLIEPASRRSSPGRFATAALAAALALGGATAVVLLTQSLTVAAVTLVLAFAVAVVGLHRYAHLRVTAVSSDGEARGRSTRDGRRTTERDRESPDASVESPS